MQLAPVILDRPEGAGAGQTRLRRLQHQTARRLLDPGGVYRSTIDTVPVRDDDQEHISLYGGMFLRPQILPTLVRLGLPHEQLRNGPVTTTTTGR